LKQKIEKLDATKDDLSSRLIAADTKLASQHQTITNLEDVFNYCQAHFCKLVLKYALLIAD